MNRKRLIMIMAALIIACGATALLWPPKPQTAIMTHNGDRLTLEKVTFGTNHVFSDRPRILAQLVKAVPALGKVIHLLPRIWRTTSEARIGLWFSEFNTRSNLYVEPVWQAVQVVDEHGCILYSCNLGYNRGQGPKKIRDDLLKAWPREQKQFTVNVFDQFYKADAPVATFMVRNPHPVKPAASPKANPLPAETTVGPVTVRLKRINVLGNAPRTPYLQPEFEFLEQGRKSLDWSVEEVTWGDANGNYTGYSGPGQVGLCLREPVWIVKGFVAKRAEGQFPPENVWSLPALKLPGPGEASGLSLSTNFQGVKLSILGIGGPGQIIYSNGIPIEAKVVDKPPRGSMSVRSGRIEMECERHHLMVDCVGLGKDQRLDLRYQQLPSGKPGPDIRMVMSSGTHQVYPFKVDPGTEAIKVEAIVQSAHRVELAVQPPRK